MNRLVVGLAVVGLLLSGCGVVQGATGKERPSQLPRVATQQIPSVTFFKNQFYPNVHLTLKPDPFVQKELSNANVSEGDGDGIPDSVSWHEAVSRITTLAT